MHKKIAQASALAVVVGISAVIVTGCVWFVASIISNLP
jgi:hypothetical protein